MKSDAERRTQLDERLAELEDRVEDIDEEIGSEDSDDWEDQASERQGDEVLTGLSESAVNEIRMIKAALKRLDEGEYGYCTICGKRISEDRLDLLPATPFCKDDAR
ncbi:dimethylmenaquinone methyltransferase [Haematobacter massiliensis]|uniref:Dimethylmenaquinone methyltransferase n=1 Tax=Haematobacter massiliensis TaxID=195105 RepID=A0A086YCV7_9RHOB|nr:TraR/DksA C4-type zinc finger protein [Haematobacter massiliensis]KFI32107.1 dimethylmenaquinone methyltransferase [Haematobacter massiliensis]OWJ72706.1 dimethylmenaquinone methyltransferase [Haematobacter massiliensis]OWJ85750.1 dimethylmenaquinone methyltransferase [Haematobacter massiliensis]QBJ24490.1 TraR/DksA family transcriptional regulator [Haematobacter massiliensis]